MKLSLPATPSNKKTSKKLFLFFVMISFAVRVFAQGPAITSFSPASGAIGTLVTINGTNLATPTAFSIGGVRALVINNTGTVLTGFVMPGAVTGAISLTTSGGSASGSSNFTVTPTLFPAAQQGSMLVGTGNIGAPQEGFSIAVSADGNTAIVGGPQDYDGEGAAWIYTRNSSGAWTQQGSKLVGTGNTGLAGLGLSVAISADGNTAIVGGWSDNNDVGAVWVFTRSGGTWSQQGGKLVGSGNIGQSHQGWSISLSADGNTFIVGAPEDDPRLSINGNTGAAWVFVRSGGIWSQQGNKLVGAGAVGSAYQGGAVALSADGNTAIVTGAADNNGQGAAWVYTRSGATWSQQGSKLVSPGSNGLGQSVSLSADGNTALIDIHVFTRSGGIWSQQGDLLSGTGHVGSPNPGGKVSLSADGNTVIVGVSADNNSVGAVWVFTRSGNTWSQQGSKLVATGYTGLAQQGWSVSLSANGNTALIGGPNAGGGRGGAWVYTIPSTITSFSPASGPVGTLVTINGTNLGTPTTFSIGGAAALIINNTGTVLTGLVMPGAATGPVSLVTNGVTATASGSFTVTPTPYPAVQQGSKLVGTGGAGFPQQGYSLSLSADGNTAIVGGPDDNSSQGAAWVYTRSGVKWSQQGGKLVGTGNTGAARQGGSVAISADGNTAIVGGNTDNSNQGAAWVYTRSGGNWSQQGNKLVGTGNTGAAGQGQSVSLSGDGNTAIVGGNTDNANHGAAWVYTRSGGTWSQQGNKLVGSGNTGAAQQGWSVAVSADGNTAIVGGDQDNSGQGGAWVYWRGGGIWHQQSIKLVGTGNTGAAGQGQSVSVSADGSTAIVGGNLDNSGQGAAWVYARSGNTWSQQGGKLMGAGNTGAARQGQSVSISADGNTAVVGGNLDNSSQGAAWVYTRSGSTWSQRGNKLSGTGSTGATGQGFSVFLSANGNTAIVGGNNDNSNRGAAWVFAAPTNALLSTIRLTPASTLVNTGTVGSTTTYTTSVVNATASVTVTPTAQDASATIKVNGATVTSGTASGAIALAEGAGTTITTVVTAEDGITTRTYAIIVTRAPSADASLSNLAISSGTLTPAFAAGTPGYSAKVTYATTGISVTPTSTDPNATITVNGTAVTSGKTSGSIALSVGANTITTVVTAQNGTVTRTYSITVARPSNNALLSSIRLTPAATLTNTGTSGTTTTYTATVSNATTSVTVTPTAQDTTATITVNGIAVTSGKPSGSIALTVGANTITTVLTAQDGTATHTYSLTITRLSNNALISMIGLTPATLLTNTGTTGSTTTYTTSAASATASVTVTPTAQDPTATIKVNGVTVPSGIASGAIAIPFGQTTINTVVTAQDGTTHTYLIIVTRLSDNALVSTIKLTPASALTNTGTIGTTTNYTTSVSNATTSVTVTATTADANATIKVNGVAVTSGTASGSIALAVGANTITTVVTAQDGATTHTYTIIATRAKSSNASLSMISLTPASTLTNTGTSAGTTTYTTSVSNATTSVTVTATTQDPTATIEVNGVAVASGTASGSIALSVGLNIINTIVTAQDGTTARYSIDLTRASGPLMSLYLPVSDTKPAEDITIENDGVMVHQGVSPNGDGINDFLIIDGIIAYPDNHLSIIDRSGSLVYQAKGYNNVSKVFDGRSSINGRMQQPGTYFYSLYYSADGQIKHKTGFIVLKY